MLVSSLKPPAVVSSQKPPRREPLTLQTAKRRKVCPSVTATPVSCDNKKQTKMKFSSKLIFTKYRFKVHNIFLYLLNYLRLYLFDVTNMFKAFGGVEKLFHNTIFNFLEVSIFMSL